MAMGQPGPDASAPNVVDDQGRKQGPWVRLWYQSDKVRYTGQFKDDRPVGRFNHYATDGKLESVVDHYADSDAAHARHFHPNGRLMAEGRYDGQRKDSTWNYFDPEGRLRRVENFHLGMEHGDWTAYYPDGAVVERKHYENGLLEGRFEQFHPNGQLQMEARYENGEPEGTMTWYYPDGKKEIQGDMVNGQREGAWIYYNPDGTIQIQVLYQRGEYVKDKKENGTFKEHYDDERLKSETTYKRGLREGPHSEYHPDGEWVRRPVPEDPVRGTPADEEMVLEGQTLKLECIYRNDRLHGTLKEYDAEGRLVRQEEYIEGELVKKVR